MRFEIRRLNGDDTVVGGVTLVESVPRKLFPIAVDGFGDVLFHPVPDRTIHKFLAMFLNIFFLLL